MLTDAGSIPATSTKPQKHKGHRKVAFVFVHDSRNRCTTR